MKLHETLLASIDKVIDTLQPRVAYATATEFAYASGCWGCAVACEGSCADACVGACDGTCEGMCTVACVGACSGTCEGSSEGSCIDNVQNTLTSKLQ